MGSAGWATAHDRLVLHRLRPHAVLGSQMRHHQTDVLKADIRGHRFLDVLKPLDPLFQASRLNLRLGVGRNPLRIQFHLPGLDEARHRTNDGRYLSRANAGNLLKAAPFVQEPKRLFRWHRLLGHWLRSAGSPAKVPQSLKKLRSIYVCLLFANAWDLLQLRKIGWAPTA